MRPRRLVLTAAAVAALAAATTACGPENSDPAPAASAPATTATAPATAPPAATPAPATTPAPASAPASTTATATGKPSTPAQAAGGCGAKDLVLTAKVESQAGGYVLITAKAKPGVTCTLPARPVIAFGSGGIEAAKAEQAAAQPIRLSGSDAAYAGVMTKTTKDNQAIQFNDVIVGISTPDPDPVSLPIGPTNVDKPIVTNWHSKPTDAVPIH
ncbi:hypothetical protein ACIQ9P_23630 [Kitasatospora sp. NPDC094019]|uniref:hypothetical protein n=1 Tax=Kitasatospora sp. NPDC094019 TaxID=3364091 RepID=UPI0038255FCE